MTANIDIITDVAKDVLYLPLIALNQNDGKSAVTLRLPSGEDQLRPIVLGLRNESVITITEGLKEGSSYPAKTEFQGTGIKVGETPERYRIKSWSWPAFNVLAWPCMVKSTAPDNTRISSA